MKMKVKTKDKLYCLAIVLICLFIIGLLSIGFYIVYIDMKDNNIKPNLFSGIIYCIFYIYALVLLIKNTIRLFICGIVIDNDNIKIRVLGRKGRNKFISYYLKGEKSDLFKYDFNYNDIKEYGIYDGYIYLILNDKTKIHFDKTILTEDNLTLLFDKIKSLTNKNAILENDFIVNYKEYDKYGKIVFSKQTDLYTKYEIREKNNEYRIILFRKKYLNNFKEYKQFENGLNVLWIEDERCSEKTNSLKDALKISKDFLK